MRLTLGPWAFESFPPIVVHVPGADERGPTSHTQLLIIRAEPLVVSEGHGVGPPELCGEPWEQGAFVFPEQGRRSSRFGLGRG